MIRLLLFLKKIYVLLLFVGLEIVCLSIFLSQSPYQRAKMVGVSNYFVGGIHSYLSGVSSYFSLTDQNLALLRENAELHAKLSAFLIDTLSVQSTDISTPKVVRVVNNSYTKRNNYIVIAAGTRQGIVPDMALFNSDGIVGYVKHCSANYSVAISMLNHQDFRTSGKIRDTDNPGSINWDGVDYRQVTMDEIPAHTEIKVGDTIVTTDYSNIFPPDIPIGVVVRVENANSIMMVARLRTMADMSRLNYLYAVSLRGQRERQELEATIPEEVE